VTGRQIASCAAWLALLPLNGCGGSGAKADLPTLKSARSVTAEWTMIARLCEQNRLTVTYCRQMRRAAKEQLISLSETAAKASDPAAEAIGAAAGLPQNALSAALRPHADQLMKMENGVETR
jgi:hypothetical protein